MLCLYSNDIDSQKRLYGHIYTVYIQSIYSLYTAYSLHNKSVINKKLKK